MERFALSDRMQVFVGGDRAGDLERLSGGYRFVYRPEYTGPPVFLNLPVQLREKQWDRFPPSFDALLPEGVLLDQLLATAKLDRQDKWGQLAAVGGDVIGMLSLFEDGKRNPRPAAILAEKRKTPGAIQLADWKRRYAPQELVAVGERTAD